MGVVRHQCLQGLREATHCHKADATCVQSLGCTAGSPQQSPVRARRERYHTLKLGLNTLRLKMGLGWLWDRR